MDLTNDDVADILALLDSLPYDALDLRTDRFHLTLRRTPGGWTEESELLTQPTDVTPEVRACRGGRVLVGLTVADQAGGADAGCDRRLDRGGRRGRAGRGRRAAAGDVLPGAEAGRAAVRSRETRWARTRWSRSSRR